MRRPWPDTGAARRADLAACRATLRAGSRSFFAASYLLPRGVREPASAVYAFCRVADDAIDLGGGDEAIARLHERLDRVYAGRPLPVPADRALAGVVASHAIPRALPEALLEGLAWDAAGRRYEDLADLYAYAARVAGAVGAMMTVLMGARAPEIVARACDLGIAMQLSNIARDVGEDARAGRLYLPLQWLREAGVEPEAWLARPVLSSEVGAVVQRLLGVADGLYARADAGIARLPRACRPGIGAARLLYAEIGREVARAGFDSISRRATVPAWRKAGLLARSLAAAPARGGHAPPLTETRFLVEAVAAASPQVAPSKPRRPARSQPGLGAQVTWLVELFDRLERRKNRLAAAMPGEFKG